MQQEGAHELVELAVEHLVDVAALVAAAGLVGCLALAVTLPVEAIAAGLVLVAGGMAVHATTRWRAR